MRRRKTQIPSSTVASSPTEIFLLIPSEVKPSAQLDSSSDGAAVYHWHTLPSACLIALSEEPGCLGGKEERVSLPLVVKVGMSHADVLVTKRNRGKGMRGSLHGIVRGSLVARTKQKNQAMETVHRVFVFTSPEFPSELRTALGGIRASKSHHGLQEKDSL